MGINALLQIFNEEYYSQLEGGILEALGRLFNQDVRLFVYPMTREAYLKYVETTDLKLAQAQMTDLPDLVTASEVHVLPHLKHLYMHLLSMGNIVPIEHYSDDHLYIFSRDVLHRIGSKDSSWEKAVPEAAIRVIKEKKMFGYSL